MKKSPLLITAVITVLALALVLHQSAGDAEEAETFGFFAVNTFGIS